MKRSVLTIATTVLITLGLPATVFAGGGNYFPPVTITPAKTLTTKAETKSSAVIPAAPACTGMSAPGMTLYSPSENPVNENPAGVWTLDLYSTQQNDAEWTVYWTGSANTAYDFEVSTSAATSPSTGKFVSPIAADSVTGTATQSDDMTIMNGQTFYFQLNATGSNGCPGKYVTGKISALFDPTIPLAAKSHSGPQGTQLFGLALITSLALVVIRRYVDLRAGRHDAAQNDELYV